VFITTFVPLPRKYDPLVTAPAKAFIANFAVVWPEPPLAIATVPVTLAAFPEMLPLTALPEMAIDVLVTLVT
jgi:hypothetical protein